MLSTMQRMFSRGVPRDIVSGRRGFSQIPVIDVSALVQPYSSAHDQQEAAAALHEAARRVGFFYAANTGVPADLCSNILTQARQWFDLPEATKQQIALSPQRHFRGYQSLGANVTRFDGGFARDHHEGIDFYKDVTEDLQPSSRIHGPNQWPSQLPEFEATTRAYVQRMLGLGHALMRGGRAVYLFAGHPPLGMGSGMGVTRFPGEPDTPDQSYWCMRIIRYPALPVEATDQIKRDREIDRSVQLSCGEHTDYGMLTIVNQQPDVTALQVKNSSGQWIDAEPVEGAFVCNIGDMLRVMSAGLYQPTPHRVINTSGSKTRTSVAFFYEPAFEAMVQPAADLAVQSRARLEPIRYGSHLERKVFSNFEL